MKCCREKGDVRWAIDQCSEAQIAEAHRGKPRDIPNHSGDGLRGRGLYWITLSLQHGTDKHRFGVGNERRDEGEESAFGSSLKINRP
jgi:hypothetical protein